VVQLHLVVVEKRPHEVAGRHAEPPLVEGHKAHHIAFRRRRFSVIGRRHSPLRLGPACPWP
jgi:hypothetical protein